MRSNMSYNSLMGLGSHSSPAASKLHLPLQETTGTVATDQSGNGNHGTIVGMGANPTVATGPTSWLPSAYSFDGVDDLVSIPSIAAGDNATLMMWIKTNADPPSSESRSGIGRFGEYPGPGAASHYPYTDSIVYASTFRGTSSSTTSRVVVGNPAPSLSAWRQLCVKTTPGAGGWKFRLDGATIKSEAGVTGVYSGEPWVLGESQSLAVKYRLQGTVAGLAFMQSHLSDADEADYFAGPEPLNLTAPVLAADGTVTSGTWDSQSNGTITRTTYLRLASDDSLVATLFTANPDFSSYVTPGTAYYVVERASNNGGYDAAEDTQSNTATIGVKTWQLMTGQTASTLTIPNVQAGDYGRQFRCVATNAAGSATSNSAEIAP